MAQASTTSSASPRGRDAAAFGDRVAEVVGSTQPGELLTYGEVALEAGAPGAARAVGNVLRAHGGGLPWWRVVTSTGRLVPGLEQRHAELLAAEGVACRDGRVEPAARRRPTPPEQRPAH